MYSWRFFMMAGLRALQSRQKVSKSGTSSIEAIEVLPRPP
jgi:hypothetical protein